MAEIVIHGDVVTLLAGYLPGALLAVGWPRVVPCGARIPDPRPAEFVRLRRIGGVRATIVSDEPTVSVECYAPLGSVASELAMYVRAVLLAMPDQDVVLDGHPVYRVTEAAGPGELPDPTTPELVRYSFTLAVHLRGAIV